MEVIETLPIFQQAYREIGKQIRHPREDYKRGKAASRGCCWVTAVVLQRIFGGKILTYKREHATVFEDKDGNRYDFTSDQYRTGVKPPQVMPFNFKDCAWQYPKPKARDKLLERFVREKMILAQETRGVGI